MINPVYNAKLVKWVKNIGFIAESQLKYGYKNGFRLNSSRTGVVLSFDSTKQTQHLRDPKIVAQYHSNGVTVNVTKT
jgi:hypothetical protein